MQRTVIVGGASGIGLATAHTLTARGYDVVIVGRDAGKLAAARAELGEGVAAEAADAGDSAAMTALFLRLQVVDHLVLAASGGRGAGDFAALDAGALRGAFEAKFWTHWTAARAALRHMTPRGSITFITAASSRLANPGTSGLAAVNGAIEKMTPTLARELAPLRVNAVSPGVIATPWWDDKPQGLFEAMSARAPLQRAGRAEEVADAVAFLIGNEFVTGVTLDVDGGLHLT